MYALWITFTPADYPHFIPRSGLILAHLCGLYPQTFFGVGNPKNVSSITELQVCNYTAVYNSVDYF
ncbi:Hypothetical protein CpOVID04_0002 [Corynebacterium pseudotuberculosis]|nr:Hypothetical protein CpCAP1R_0002 [Corynebacterium pseudotuberculosis]QCG71555.1 Hypothetical protein CpOVI1FL_0002 [Corynebacterium pseudotuberculosis]QDL39908.1 Hypothetical protein CpOVID04_0002 [Corynebacterium pseudotuberculosis]QDL42013.1 Hypothetical protein CpOVIZ01_0002 [Corynebacterium pseudotuberculosis]QDL48367.1 hypothetical protein CpOVICCA32_0002 [Corynebacterium pseudotuberculosis]